MPTDEQVAAVAQVIYEDLGLPKENRQSERAMRVIRAALSAAEPVIDRSLPPTGPYVDRIIRIFRDHPSDDGSAAVLQDYARATLNQETTQ